MFTVYSGLGKIIHQAVSCMIIPFLTHTHFGHTLLYMLRLNLERCHEYISLKCAFVQKSQQANHLVHIVVHLQNLE